MAVKICPECGKEISEHAKSCIHCGYPLEEKNHLNSTESSLDTQEEKANINHRHFAIKVLSVIAVLIVVFVGVLLLKPKTDIVGIWETTLDAAVLRYEFRENGEFHSNAVMNGFQVPGGDGTYTINGNEITVDMSNGSQIISEFSIKNGKLNLDGFTWEKVN